MDIRSMKAIGVPALLVPIGLAIAVVVALILIVVGAPLVVAVPVAVVLGAAVAVGFFLAAEPAVVGKLQVRIVDDIDEPRLYNMVDGLCDSHGFRQPTLAVVHDDAQNAVVYGRTADRATLAVTSGLLAQASRMELEGLLARELALANHPGLPAATVLVPILRVLPAGLRARVLGWFLGAQRTVLDDIGAVRYTRYPPGLVAALDALGRGSTVVAGAGHASSHLWVVTPTATASAGLPTPTIDERIAALREL
jgi:heat shock protein HtpX